MSWADSMAVLNETLLDTFPDEITFNGVTYPCIAPPLELVKRMTDNPYEAGATAQFDMRESDRATAKINTRDFVTYTHPALGTLSFQVYAINPDKNISLTQLRCNLKQ